MACSSSFNPKSQFYLTPVDTSPVTEGVTLFKHRLLLLLLLLLLLIIEQWEVMMNNDVVLFSSTNEETPMHHRCRWLLLANSLKCGFFFAIVMVHNKVKVIKPKSSYPANRVSFDFPR